MGLDRFEILLRKFFVEELRHDGECFLGLRQLEVIPEGVGQRFRTLPAEGVISGGQVARDGEMAVSLRSRSRVLVISSVGGMPAVEIGLKSGESTGSLRSALATY